MKEFDRLSMNSYSGDYAKKDSELNERSNEVERILDSLQDGIYVTDGSGKTLWINQAYTNKTGITKDEVIGKDIRELVSNGVFDNSITVKVLETRKPIVILQKIKESDEVWLVKGNPVFNHNGEVIRVVNIIHDVTELSKLKFELKSKETYVSKIIGELNHLRSQILEIDGLIASSYEMQKVLSLVQRLSKLDTTVLLLGESGTGKSAIAKLLHNLSKRKKNAFVQLNCGAIPENLLESELFGYTKGSFTGANSEGKIGLIELANEGTLFLDEIGEMPIALQVKLLHFLQEKQIRRIGDTKDLNVNTRVLAATNKDLELLVKKGLFREDLYYRLSVVPIRIPALRERKDDLYPLVNLYLDKFKKKYNLNKTMSNEVMDVLERYSWPGNVRELENLIEQLMIISREEIIGLDDLPQKFSDQQDIFELEENVDNLKEYINKVERDLIQKVWDQTQDQSAAANLLGVHRTTFSRKAKKLGIRLY